MTSHCQQDVSPCKSSYETSVCRLRATNSTSTFCSYLSSSISAEFEATGRNDGRAKGRGMLKPRGVGLTSDCHATRSNPQDPLVLPQITRKGGSDTSASRVNPKSKDTRRKCSEKVPHSFRTHLSVVAWTAPSCPGKRNPCAWVRVHKGQTRPLHVSSGVEAAHSCFRYREPRGQSTSGRRRQWKRIPNAHAQL